MRRWWRAAAGAGVGLGLVVGAAVGYSARWLSGPQRPPRSYGFTPFEVGLPAEDVEFTSDDGVRLAGWWFDDPDAAVTVVCCHGHRGNRADMLGIGPGLFKQGFSVLLFDLRGNGDSDDGPQSLAHHERADLRAAVDWASARRPDTRIAVVAFSMGASMALLEAADDQRIEAVVADSAFATITDLAAGVLARYRLPSVPMVNLVDAWTRRRYGYGFGQVRPLDAIARIAPRPVLLLHGTNDAVIPYEHATWLAEAGGAELVTFEGADHCGGYFMDRPGYIDRVATFLRDALG